MTEPRNPTAPRGMALPINPERAAAVIESMNASASDGSEREAVKRAAGIPLPTVEGERKKNQARDNMTIRTAGSIGMAIDKKREPLQSLTTKGIPHDIETPEDRLKVRQWSRKFYKSHNLMSTAIDIYTQFPIQGIEVISKDPEIKRFYESYIFDTLKYENLMENFGREYWTVGEVNSLGSWNETLGIWDAEQILNPDDIVVDPGSILGIEDKLYLKIPETIKRIIQTQTPRWEYDMLLREYPEIVEAATARTTSLGFSDGDMQVEGIDPRELLAVSPHVLSRTINQVTPWDIYGSPHMMRAFGSLIMEESLNAAQDAVADRLYSPMILAKLGIPSGDLGDGGGFWLPNEQNLADFTSLMQSAFASDFRFLAYHYGIEIKSVFGKESLPNFDRDYDRLERKMLQVWGIGEGLISGSSSGTYASSALNREFVTQLMSGFQKKIQEFFKKRMEIVAEAQGHYDYESSGGVRSVITEQVLETDEETGEQYIRTRPKLLVPELSFKTMNLRDEKEERNFLQMLKNNGIPISDQSFMVNIDLEFEDEVEKLKEEKMQKVIAEQEMKAELFKRLSVRGLPIPADLAAEMAKVQPGGEQDPNAEESDLPGEQGRPDSGLPGTQGRPEELPGTVGRPQKGEKQKVEGLPMPGQVGRPGEQINGVQGRPVSAPGGRVGRPKAAALNGITGSLGPIGETEQQRLDREAGIEFTDDNEDEEQSAASADGALPDITDPTPTPNLAPDDDTETPQQGKSKGKGGGSSSLPQNEIRQRPEISDEQRGSAPKSGSLSSLRRGPASRGLSAKLTLEAMQDMVDKRPWTRSLKDN